MNTFELDILKALKGSDPLTAEDLFAGDMHTDDEGRIIRRAAVIGPMPSILVDLRRLHRKEWIEPSGDAWRITEAGASAVAEHYEELRQEIARRYANR